MDVAEPKLKRGRKRKSNQVQETAATSSKSKAAGAARTPTTPAVVHSPSAHDLRCPVPLLRPSGKTADWDDFLSEGYNLHFIPPVDWFKHAPLANIWKEISKTGLIVEAPNPFVRCHRKVNWYATILHYAGYKALIEFQCLGVKPNHVAWMSFCSKVPKQIGYSDKNKILLHPPYVVRAEFPDYLAKTRALLTNTNASSVREDHGTFIRTEVEKCIKYPLGTLLEVMDRDNIHRMRVASVTSIIGDRIHVLYVIEPKEDDTGFWFNCNSDSVHPLGWSQTVGHEIYGVPLSAQFTPLSPDYFPKYPAELNLARGQMFETRHPIKPHLIVAASVVRVLNYGYFVAEIRTTNSENQTPVRFSYHLTSPYIFPCGFSANMKIDLVPPYESGRKGRFSWDDYLLRHKLDPAPLHLLPKRPSHNFKPGMKFETAWVINPTYLGPTTVRKVRGHMLYLSFDGWPCNPAPMLNPPEVWMDADSRDIYPVGFAELVAHEFQGRVEAPGLRDLDERFRNDSGETSAEEVE